MHAVPTVPTSRSPSSSGSPVLGGGAQAQARAGVRLRLAPVVQPRDRLLADVAALLEVDGPLDDPRLGGHRLGAHVEPEPGPPGLDPDDLGGLLAHLGGARLPEQLAQRSPPASAPVIRSRPEVGGDRQDLDPVPSSTVALGVLGPRPSNAGELGGARGRSAR